MKPDTFLLELESIIIQLGYQLRKEKGSFKGDFCVLEGDKIIMINKMYPTEYHVGQIVRFLRDKDLHNMYIKPAVRKELDRWFDRIRVPGNMKETE